MAHAFDLSDSELAAQSGGVASRAELLADAGTVVIAKPTVADLQELRDGRRAVGLCALRAAARHHPGRD